MKIDYWAIILLVVLICDIVMMVFNVFTKSLDSLPLNFVAICFAVGALALHERNDQWREKK